MWWWFTLAKMWEALNLCPAAGFNEGLRRERCNSFCFHTPSWPNENKMEAMYEDVLALQSCLVNSLIVIIAFILAAPLNKICNMIEWQDTINISCMKMLLNSKNWENDEEPGKFLFRFYLWDMLRLRKRENANSFGRPILLSQSWNHTLLKHTGITIIFFHSYRQKH